MWYWWRMEKVKWTNRVKNEEVLHRVQKERNILHTIKMRKTNLIGYILCRNCLLKHIIEGNLEQGIEVIGRIRKQPLDNIKERRGCRQLKVEALYRTVWNNYEPVVRQAAGWVSSECWSWGNEIRTCLSDLSGSFPNVRNTFSEVLSCVSVCVTIVPCILFMSLSQYCSKKNRTAIIANMAGFFRPEIQHKPETDDFFFFFY